MDMLLEDLTDRSPQAPPSGTQERNLRLAFAVVGALIADEHLSFDMSEHQWMDEFEITVLCVAAALNKHA